MKTDTFLGGRDLTVVFNDNSKRELKIAQIKLGEYHKAFPLIMDEMKLVAFATGLTEAELNEVHPESYEELRAATWSVNEKGFFAYAARTRDQNAAAFREMPAEVLKSVADKIASTLQTWSPASQPTRR